MKSAILVVLSVDNAEIISHEKNVGFAFEYPTGKKQQQYFNVNFAIRLRL